FDIDLTFDGGFIVSGYSFSSDGEVTGNHGNGDYWIIKLDSVGTLQWQKALGGTDKDASFSIKQTYDHGFIATGNTTSNDGDVSGNHGGNDYWVVKLDSLGKLEWQNALGGSGEDFALSIIQTSDSGYVVAGSSDSEDGDITNNQGYDDYWIVKLGNKPVNAVKPDENVTSIATNFPNPFSDKTQIQFGKAVESPSELIIYNVLGEKIETLNIPPEAISTVFNRGKLPAGVYIYHLMSGGTLVGEGRMIVQ
ncbi:MAG: T9SS type A sorting domain-containing protein, partial [Candidatus Kapaibacterium sp.]